MRRLLKKFLFDRAGATVLEYAWIASLISIVCVTIFYQIRISLQGMLLPAINSLAS